jgi:glutaminyl-peptide cyclotransferase
MNKSNKLNLLLLLTVLFWACKTENNEVITPDKETLTLVDAPLFNKDSAFAYLEKQVSFGPRVPNSTGHQLTKQWLLAFLEAQADTVIAQNADLTAYDGTILKSTNIIAVFNPNASKRILLSAHWDTRPFADQDEDRTQEPILGANDGASGVASIVRSCKDIKKQPYRYWG